LFALANGSTTANRALAANANLSFDIATGTLNSTKFIGTAYTISGSMSGNVNVSTISGNLGIRTLASTYTDNVAAAGTIANAAIHAVPYSLTASNAITTTNLSNFHIKGVISK